MRARVAAVATVVLLCAVSSAHAHAVEGVGDFYAGMLHPVIALETLLPTIALALLAGQQERGGALLAVALFPATVGIGGLAAQFVPASTTWDAVNLVSIPVLGIAVAWARALPRWAIAAIAVTVGAALGATNGAEATASMSAWLFVPGLTVSALFLIVVVVGLVRSAEKQWARIAVRVAGSWIAAIGVMVLALSL
jgi:urease accessory protein